MINIFRKRQRNRVKSQLSQCLKRAQCLSLSDVFNAESLYSVWYYNNFSLSAYMQQTHYCECIIWETLSHMLLSITHCNSYRRVEVDQCFMMQINLVCTYCTLLCNSCDQYRVKSLIITALISERSDVVVLHIHVYDDKEGDSTL